MPRTKLQESRKVTFLDETDLSRQLALVLECHELEKPPPTQLCTDNCHCLTVAQTYATCATKQCEQPHDINKPLLGTISCNERLSECSQDSIKLGIWVNAGDVYKSDQFYIETIQDDELLWKVFIRETINSEPFSFIVSNNCVLENCTCEYYIAGVSVQLKPCRSIVEILLRGDTDSDWTYISWGVVFGFRVTNPSCDINYTIKPKEIMDLNYRQTINKKVIVRITTRNNLDS